MVIEVIAVTMVAPLPFFFQRKRDSSVTKAFDAEFDCRQAYEMFPCLIAASRRAPGFTRLPLKQV
jgi:hypothetical protein